jgi:exodeoxyribonuclease-5
VFSKEKSLLKSELLKNFLYEPTLGQYELIEKLCDFIFCTEQNPVFILKGYAGTGKTSIIGALTKSLPTVKQRTLLLAPTGRASKVLGKSSNKAAFTIHKKIYKAAETESGGPYFMLQNNSFVNTLIIVDEASMIGDSQGLKGELGRNLLEDLFTFAFQGDNCKLLLIGDTAQLPPVGLSLSHALDKDYLKKNFHLSIFNHELTEVMRQSESSGILTNATKLRNILNEKNISFPKFSLSNFKDIVKVEGLELQENLEDSYSKAGKDETIIITKSNKRANLYNQQIRNRIFMMEEELASGDLMMVVKNNYFWFSKNKNQQFIANGDIIKIRKVKSVYELFGFKFADVIISLIDFEEEPEFDCTLLLDTIYSETPALTNEQNRKLYLSVLESYADIENKAERFLKLKQDKYFNALQVKFSYAVTCHKAQGGQWGNVFVDQGFFTEEGLTADYLKWLYTATTRASEKLYLIGFDDKFFE